MQSTQQIQHVLNVGIFSDERVLQILHILQTLSDNCFSKLHEVANEGQPNTEEYAFRFRKGLNSIELWKQNIKNEITKQAIEAYKELPILYKYAIVRYLQELYKHDDRKVIPVNIPPLQDFIHSYYLKLAKSKYMQNLEFLKVYGLERTHMHMEALRSVLMDFARDSIYDVPTSSTVLGDRIQDYRPVENHIRGLRGVERDVTPDDTVSQRGDQPFRDEFQQSGRTDRTSDSDSDNSNKGGNDDMDMRSNVERGRGSDRRGFNDSDRVGGSGRRNDRGSDMKNDQGSDRRNDQGSDRRNDQDSDRKSKVNSDRRNDSEQDVKKESQRVTQSPTRSHHSKHSVRPSKIGQPIQQNDQPQQTQQNDQPQPHNKTEFIQQPSKPTPTPPSGQSRGLEVVKEDNSDDSDKHSRVSESSSSSSQSPKSPTSLHTIHIQSKQQVFE